jgi:hypothetical protein
VKDSELEVAIDVQVGITTTYILLLDSRTPDRHSQGNEGLTCGGGPG